ncbi:IDEAL domain-containing protein [Gracilibacillus caseinilyticus]|uniref:IDEAL domain-containing protein n=1 Tax=Gracilibacillus caseinilyticus TaxID=2932256 RepID=A0ABY4EX81_9BACI|nr:IDEAL domain-containing protein [Gracilibacillus caseinilyticus]UOQ46781.1 IDEAL domain-containing protein [Gracilibacillus caseinilyticus]
MKKHKVSYQLKVFSMNQKQVLKAKREIPFEIQLASQLVLDDLCFSWNKARLEEKINQSIDDHNKEAFEELSKTYSSYIWES